MRRGLDRESVCAARPEEISSAHFFFTCPVVATHRIYRCSARAYIAINRKRESWRLHRQRLFHDFFVSLWSVLVCNEAREMRVGCNVVVGVCSFMAARGFDVRDKNAVRMWEK